MRKSASEIISDLEMRVARLENRKGNKMNPSLKKKLEEAFGSALNLAYGPCETIDGVRSWVGDRYYYGGYISNGDNRLNPRGEDELYKDPSLKKMGIKITEVETNQEIFYPRGNMDIRIYFTLKEI